MQRFLGRFPFSVFFPFYKCVLILLLGWNGNIRTFYLVISLRKTSKMLRNMA